MEKLPIIKLSNVVLKPTRILHCIIDIDLTEYTYIILGRSGATGKTWLCEGLKMHGFNAIEISENINAFVSYGKKRNDELNHIVIDEIRKYVVIILNEYLEK
jgi:hypothetical protein